MFCNKCGNQISQGQQFCNSCGTVAQNVQPQPQQFNQQQQPMPGYQQNVAQNNGSSKKPVKIIIGVLVGIIVLVIAIFVIVSLTSKKLVCKSPEGNITLMYNDKTITGYTASGITYDLEQQQEVAEQIGIDQYLDDFSTWFSDNTSGSCTR